MNYSEAVSKRFFESYLPGSRMDYNTAQSNGEHDFNLHFNDGTIAALEVTSCVDPVKTSTMAAIRSKKRGGSEVAATKCKKNWVAFVAPGASVNRVREHIDEYLSRLEFAGVNNFYMFDARHACVEDLRRDLGVVSASVWDAGSPPIIKLTLTASGGAVGASTAVEVGEHEAQKADNRRKLAAAGTAERALVVYIDPASGLPWAALTDFRPPATVANLPPEVTSLWLVGPTGKRENEFVGWYGSASQPWQGGTIMCN
jgi:hypothetical protein